ncbi:MAG: hypothetical protein PHW60_16520 [Kiritimatiellae bacterium]|nr:hypothetical protein [Kiritimatiellia bacterium]
MADNMLNEPFPATDIVFRCGVCGKGLVINALGAGLEITCPNCGAEMQVPQSGNADGANPEDEQSTVEAGADEEKADWEFPEISDVLADAHEQINALKTENDELQFRRRFLEKRHALVSQDMQALRQEISVIRKAMDRAEAILKTMEDPPASDTQPIA